MKTLKISRIRYRLAYDCLLINHDVIDSLNVQLSPSLFEIRCVCLHRCVEVDQNFACLANLSNLSQYWAILGFRLTVSLAFKLVITFCNGQLIYLLFFSGKFEFEFHRVF